MVEDAARRGMMAYGGLCEDRAEGGADRQGRLTLGVDLSTARIEQVNTQRKTAVLLLPQPQVQSVRLDHERTKLIGLWPSGLWTIVPDEQEADAAVVNAAYEQAERTVAEAAKEPAAMDRARRQSQIVLGSFLAALGWRVELRWMGGT